jgi:hypothetical protein
MKTETKQWIFFLLTLGLSITFAVLATIGIRSLLGCVEPFDPMEDFLGVFILTGVFFAPIAYIMNAVFDFFGIFSEEDSTSKNHH